MICSSMNRLFFIRISSGPLYALGFSDIDTAYVHLYGGRRRPILFGLRDDFPVLEKLPYLGQESCSSGSG